jgi:catechol 2,3-dioxygenase-like lactoylglutathione lyase family enzyme
VIKGVHTMFYSPKAEEIRAFLRDKLGFPYTDVGEGWLIFDLPEADMGCHPSDRTFHELSFYTDDLEQTVVELKERGVVFTKPIEDHGYGFVTYFKLPDDTEVQLYQPKYAKSR